MLNADGTPVASFNGGQPVHTDRYALEQNHPVPGALPTPHESLRVPAIGDIDGDREAEIVATAGEHVYAWDLRREQPRRAGSRCGSTASLSEPCKPGVPKPCFDAADRAIFTDDRGTPASDQNHIKRGFFGSPALADLDCDGRLDIVAGSLDQHLYAWDGNGDAAARLPGEAGQPRCGRRRDRHLAGDRRARRRLQRHGRRAKGPEIVVATNEVIPADPGSTQPELPRLRPRDLQHPARERDRVEPGLRGARRRQRRRRLAGQGRRRRRRPAAAACSRATTRPCSTTNGDGRRRGLGLGGHLGRAGRHQARRRRRGHGHLVRERHRQQPRPGPGPQPRRLPVGRRHPRSRPAGGGQGRPDGQRRRQPARRQPEPSLQPRRAGLGASTRAARASPARLPGRHRRLPARLAGLDRPRRRLGPGAQALVGTGLYQLHAYGPGGLERAGWPKFTGGWMQATPAVGDADGDGDLDVTTVTREGWSFLWDTGVDACGGSNDEWWTFHHDEHSTNNYGIDGRPPGTPRGLSSARDERWLAFPELDRARRRLAVRHRPTSSRSSPRKTRSTTPATGPSSSSSAPAPPPTNRRRLRSPPPSSATPSTSPSSTATRPATGAGWRAWRSPPGARSRPGGRSLTTQGPKIGFSAVNNCTASLSTQPSTVGTTAGSNIWIKNSVTQSSCTDQPPPSPLGFDTQTGTASGTFGPSAPGGRNGQQGTLQWTYFNGSPDRVQFTLRDSSNTVVFQANQQTPSAYRGSPGGVWTFGP